MFRLLETVARLFGVLGDEPQRTAEACPRGSEVGILFDRSAVKIARGRPPARLVCLLVRAQEEFVSEGAAGNVFAECARIAFGHRARKRAHYLARQFILEAEDVVER